MNDQRMSLRNRRYAVLVQEYNQDLRVWGPEHQREHTVTWRRKAWELEQLIHRRAGVLLRTRIVEITMTEVPA